MNIKFNKKDLEVINRVIELEELEPENNHLRVTVLQPLNGIMCSYKWVRDTEMKYYLESLVDELSGYGYMKCNRGLYDRRLKALRTVLEKKLERIKNKY